MMDVARMAHNRVIERIGPALNNLESRPPIAHTWSLTVEHAIRYLGMRQHPLPAINLRLEGFARIVTTVRDTSTNGGDYYRRYRKTVETVWIHR